MKKIILPIIIILVAISIVIITLRIKEEENIVARYVTDEHYRYSPVVLNSEIYFPASNVFEEHENLESIGHLGAKDKGFINDIFLDVGAVLVENQDDNYVHFTVQDDNTMSYSNGEYLQNPNFIKNNMDIYNNFVLCNDSNNTETRIGIKKELLKKLQEEFARLKYDIEDFNNCNDIYYIYVDSPKEKIHERTFDDPIVYMGCILAKDGKLYYGNLTNEIKGDLHNQLKGITSPEVQ